MVFRYTKVCTNHKIRVKTYICLAVIKLFCSCLIYGLSYMRTYFFNVNTGFSSYSSCGGCSSRYGSVVKKKNLCAFRKTYFFRSFNRKVCYYNSRSFAGKFIALFESCYGNYIISVKYAFDSCSCHRENGIFRCYFIPAEFCFCCHFKIPPLLLHIFKHTFKYNA